MRTHLFNSILIFTLSLALTACGGPPRRGGGGGGGVVGGGGGGGGVGGGAAGVGAQAGGDAGAAQGDGLDQGGGDEEQAGGGAANGSGDMGGAQGGEAGGGDAEGGEAGGDEAGGGQGADGEAGGIGSPVDPSPTDSCQEILACAVRCGDDANCSADCRAAGDEQGQRDWTMLLACATAENCELDDNACLSARCAEQAEPCGVEIVEGAGGCPATMQCLQQCGQNQQCADGCMNAASDDAKIHLANSMACVQLTCDSDQACAQDRCMQFDQACADDGPAEGYTCAGINACVGLYCGAQDANCQQECIGFGTRAAQEVLNDLLQCQQSNGCQDSACVDANCPDELDACFER